MIKGQTRMPNKLAILLSLSQSFPFKVLNFKRQDFWRRRQGLLNTTNLVKGKTELLKANTSKFDPRFHYVSKNVFNAKTRILSEQS